MFFELCSVENGDFVAIKQISLHGIPRDVLKSIMVRLPSYVPTSHRQTQPGRQQFCSVLALSRSLPLFLFATQSEIDLLKKLHHVNIVKYLGWNQTKEHLFIILEYVIEHESLTALYSSVRCVCLLHGGACTAH